jgi:pancreatic triacylglycerol lipase
MDSTLKIFILFATICGALSIPTPTRWEVVPDSEGRMHLVDLNSFTDEVSPAYVPEEDIIFTLCTLRNPTSCQVVQWNNMDSIRNSNFDASRPTQFTVHGWNGDGSGGVNSMIRSRYFTLGDYNMITVDWGAGAQTINYITARNRVGPTGAVVARFIDNLHEAGLLRFAETHVIGHSLGAHVVGFAGKGVTRGRIHKVVGLDPAGPLFNFNDPADRLTETDGEYVEIIHTNYGQLGFREPMGHADFYPNFGRSQPGCEGNDAAGGCSHGRAVNFYAESITDVFTAQQCTTFDGIDNNICTPTGFTARMGGPVAKPGLNGIFFLRTNAQSPFSLG